MAKNPRLQVSDTAEELKKLDEAIAKLGYKDRADWYRDMKRQTLAKADKVMESK
jgi:metal-responsive CopG/Arc/MetJ family transcriptional regulator